MNVKVSPRKSPELTQKIADLLLDMTSRILKKKPEVTAIAIEYVEPDTWVVGEQLLSKQDKTAFISTSK